MCMPAVSGRRSPERVLLPVAFDPDARCCTFQPHVWNFLAGAALLDRSAAGAVARASVLARLDSAGGTPLGLPRSRRHAALSELGGSAFGRARSLTCPHYVVDGSLCGIWQHRESTCATWFCKHEHGAVAKRFWDRLHALLRIAEESVARHAVLELDLGPEALAALQPLPNEESTGLTAMELDETRDLEHERRVWGRWAGREAAFYEEAARLAARLGWAEVVQLGGSELALASTLLRAAHAELLGEAPPAHLRLNQYSVAPGADDGTVRLGAYSGLDPLEVPLRLLGCLHYFDGRPTAEAVAAIEEAQGLTLEPALVRRLYEFGVLDAVG